MTEHQCALDAERVNRACAQYDGMKRLDFNSYFYSVSEPATGCVRKLRGTLCSTFFDTKTLDNVYCRHKYTLQVLCQAWFCLFSG